MLKDVDIAELFDYANRTLKKMNQNGETILH